MIHCCVEKGKSKAWEKAKRRNEKEKKKKKCRSIRFDQELGGFFWGGGGGE